MSKILIVEDEENIRLLYKEELEDLGYEVIQASDGREAIKKYDLHQPGLIILDIQLPGMDGIETMNIIREKSRDVPIILCSAYGEYKQDMKTWASEAYIIKSADLKELLATVKKVLTA
ncbi:MAG: response regulator [Deltaproteobacteria bacterium]|jgi:DNA-binding response OmpR family regulator|nr:response regulator [Deltaproteobacteria bacterium]MBW2184406.1 response regulator [Deltaproteobacteria bacterium]